MTKFFLLVVLALVMCAHSDALSATPDGQLTMLTTPNEDQATQPKHDCKRVLQATGTRPSSGGYDGLLPYATKKIKAGYGAVKKPSKKLWHKKKPVKAIKHKRKPFRPRVKDNIISAKDWVVEKVLAFWRFITLSKKKK